MGNRVEDLEKQVAELQATVDGLTEELVETKERLRQLETDEEPASASSNDESEPRRESDHAEFVPNGDRSQAVSPEDESDDDTAAGDDGGTTEDSQETNETDADDESDDDIIVA